MNTTVMIAKMNIVVMTTIITIMIMVEKVKTA